MTLRLAFLVSCLTLAAIAGCYTGSSVDTNRAPAGPTADTDGTEPATPDARAPISPKKAATALPCDVTAILANACGSCHGAKPSGGASSALVTYEDLAAKSDADPSKTVAQISLSRMKSADRPMPPEGRLGAASIGAFEKWVKAGLPKGTCGETKADAGSDEPDPDPSPEPEPEPEPTSTCTNGTPLSHDNEYYLMNPGLACNDCHKRGGQTIFAAAGTVYPSLHEPDQCRGASGVKVVIIDAAGNLHEMPANANGNFTYEESFPTPYRAFVVRGTDTREMKKPQTNGDCNSCHTEWGTGSPGRVMAP
jgi:cytochrome c553